jgi:hypothetical protein
METDQWSATARLERGTPEIDNSMRHANCRLPIASLPIFHCRLAIGDLNLVECGKSAIGKRQLALA